MPVVPKTRPLGPLVLMLACSSAWAGAQAPGPFIHVKYRERPRPKRHFVHTQDVVQTGPELVLKNGNVTQTPARAGFLYHLERADRGMVLLSVPSQGLRGWAPRDAVIEHNQAEGHFTTRIDLDPNNAFAHFMRAIVTEDGARADAALADLNEAVRLAPRFVPAWIERAHLWRERNRMDRAMADVHQALRIDPRSSEAYLERGALRYAMKEREPALEDFSRAIELGSRSVFAPMFRGAILLSTKGPDAAAPEFERALKIDPKHAEAFIAIGSCQLMRGRTTEALSSFSRAVEIEPENGDAHAGRASVYTMLGDPRQALREWDGAIQHDPSIAGHYRDRGVVHEQLGEWKEALSDLNQAIHLAPGDQDAVLARAWLLATCPDAKTRDGADAVASASRVCQLKGWKEDRALAVLAAAYAERGDFSNAVRWQSRALELAPAKAPMRGYYQDCLTRYRSGKPCHRVGLLEEWGLRKYHTADPDVARASATTTAPARANAAPPRGR